MRGGGARDVYKYTQQYSEMDYAYKHLSISPIGQMVFPCTYRSAVTFDYTMYILYSTEDEDHSAQTRWLYRPGACL